MLLQHAASKCINLFAQLRAVHMPATHTHNEVAEQHIRGGEGGGGGAGVRGEWVILPCNGCAHMCVCVGVRFDVVHVIVDDNYPFLEPLVPAHTCVYKKVGQSITLGEAILLPPPHC